MKFFGYEIRKIRKPRTARERLDTRGAHEEFKVLKVRAIEKLKNEQQRKEIQ